MIMNEDSIKLYQEALRKYDTVTKQVERLVEHISELSRVMKDWRHVTVSDGKTQFPSGIGKYSIDPKDFPTVQQIAGVLSAWHKVNNDLRNKWDAIPDEKRTSLQPPLLP